MHTYSAFGLGIHSQLPLSELSEKQSPDDVLIRLIDKGNLSPESRVEAPYLRLGPIEALLSIPSVGTFLVNDGRDIRVCIAPRSDLRLVKRYIVGPVMAILLYQKGLLVLHASAMEINGLAVAFVGASGAGKSSLAAAFYAHGHNFLTEDITAVDTTRQPFHVLPGYPQLKINTEAAHAIGLNGSSYIMFDELEEKRSYRIQSRLVDRPLPLSQIYLLGEDAGIGVEHLDPQEAFLALVRHSLPTRWKTVGDPRHFQQCVQLVNLVSVYQLKKPDTVQELPLLVSLVEQHLAQTRLESSRQPVLD